MKTITIASHKKARSLLQKFVLLRETALKQVSNKSKKKLDANAIQENIKASSQQLL